jgi:hypothetical protein
MGALDSRKASGFDGVAALVREGLGDLSQAWGLFGAKPGMSLEALREHFGTPSVAMLDVPEQRVLEYSVPLDHPELGSRDDHVAKIVMSSFHGEPVKTLELAVTYFGFGEDGPAWSEMAKGLEDHLVRALGAPKKKKKSAGKVELTWTRDDEELWFLNKAGSLQITVADTR